MGTEDKTMNALTLGRKFAVATVLVVGFHLVLNRVLPPLLQTEAARRNRDVPVLLAAVTAVGAAWVSYRLGFSPVLGAFIAGLLLGESRFATQIRADVAPLQVLFVTLFFSSIGMLSDPAVFADHWPVVLLAAAGIVVGKTGIAAAALRISGSPLTHALASGLVLAQVGEFSLVLADSARDGGLLDTQQFELFVAVLMVSLFATPFLVGLAPRVLTGWGRRRGDEPAGEPDLPSERMSGHLLIVGFGPAGQRIAELAMARSEMPIRVLELNQNTAGLAESYGLDVQLGDATREEVLVHADVRGAAAVAITLPDPLAARQVVRQVRALAPKVQIAVRARYHIHRWQLVVAGAHIVVDEEDEVGARIASELLGSTMEPAGGEPDSEV
jgi:CPA2 family monovalent cation:H+ antiporter-2